MKHRTTFLEKLAAMILIMAMVMPQYAAATITDVPPNIVIDANNNVTVNVDADNIGTGSFIVNDENGSLDTITTILSNAQSTVIGAGDANTITNSLTVAGTTTTNSGDFTVTGATTLSSTLSVTGNTSLSTLSTSGLATLDSASITNNATVGGTLGVTGATTLTGALTANGGATLNSADSYSSATVGNSAVTLVADSDALSTNAQSSLSMAPTSASLLVNTDTGDSHGITISQTSTVISGGMGSTTFTVDDDGATFASTTTGGPVKVTGIANGVGDYDAVNMRQYRKLEDRVDTAYSGIASVAALAAIPAPVPGKNLSLGLGFGNFESENAIAVGGKAMVGKNKDITFTAGVGYCDDTTTVSAGIGWSF